MMSSFAGFFNINHLDMSSNANDVIAIRHPDGRILSTAFNVRFGKAKVLCPGDKVVRVEINGKMTSAIMKMGPDGEAFWLKPTHLSDVDCGRPESPVFMENSSPDIVTSPKDNGSKVTFTPLPNQKIFSACEESNTNRVGTGPDTRVLQPLIEADRDGHLHVNTQLQCTGADAAELNLAEETVVLAERAMQEMKRLSHQNPEYLRDVVMHDSEGKACLQELNGFGNSLNLSGNAVVENVEVNGVPATLTSGDDTIRGGNGNNGDSAQKLQSEASAPGGNCPFYKQAPQSSSASDEGFEASTDDYIFEDINLFANVLGEERIYCPGEQLRDVGTPSSATLPIVPIPDTGFTASASPCGPSSESQNVACKPGGGAVRTSTSFYDGCRTDGSSTHAAKTGDGIYYTRSLVPIQADLLKLNLVPGHNRVRYVTHSSLRGDVAIEASVYLWESTDRLVVSDVDGTITKSDVLGHLMPLIGRDWTHPGICSLYSRIQKNGYHLVYLTARSVSQVSMTRKFLWKIKHDGVSLPKGPVLTAPKRLFSALAQEVSMKSHLFKIACLQGVISAFPPNAKPFYAGFGNRLNDVISYLAAQIPNYRIYVVDPEGSVRVSNVRSTYQQLARDVDKNFPPIVRRVPVDYAQHGADQSARALSTGTALKVVEMDTLSDGMWTDSRNSGDKLSTTPTGITSAASCGSGRGASTRPFFAFGIGLYPADDDTPPLERSGLSNVCGGCTHPNHQAHLCSPAEVCDVTVDREFDSFVYWRMQPGDVVEGDIAAVNTATGASPKEQPAKEKSSWLSLGLRKPSGTSSKNNETV